MNKPESGSNMTAIPIPPATLPIKQRRIRKQKIHNTTAQLNLAINQEPKNLPAARRMKKIDKAYVVKKTIPPLYPEISVGIQT